MAEQQASANTSLPEPSSTGAGPVQDAATRAEPAEPLRIAVNSAPEYGKARIIGADTTSRRAPRPRVKYARLPATSSAQVIFNITTPGIQPAAYQEPSAPPPNAPPPPKPRIDNKEEPEKVPNQSIRDFLKSAAPAWTVVIVIVLIIAAILALAMWPGLSHAIATLAPPLAPTSSSTLRYSDDLHRFSLEYDKSRGWNVTRGEATTGCQGQMFSTEAKNLNGDSTGYPRLSVCFLGFRSDSESSSLNDYLNVRADYLQGSHLTDVRKGLPKSRTIGKSLAQGMDTYVSGRTAGVEMKWYIAVVSHQTRVYSIEAVALAEEWEKYWPMFSALMDDVSFDSDVVKPASRTVTLEPIMIGR